MTESQTQNKTKKGTQSSSILEKPDIMDISKSVKVNAGQKLIEKEATQSGRVSKIYSF